MSDKVNNSSNKSRKVASNTVALFLRMLILMVVNLYAVRLVINGLGEQDYGIFNTVAAVVMTASFLSSVLALSMQRFYSYASGKNDGVCLNQIFSVSIIIVSITSLVLLAGFETIGTWFVNTQLSIPADRIDATLVVYQFAIMSFVFALIQVPFLAAIFSHENMSLYTIVSTFECLGRLLIAVLITVQPFDKLVFYGGGLSLVALIVMITYIYYACRNYEECVLTKVSDKSLYRQLLKFSGWSAFGTIASTFMLQGGTILLNIFFGSLATAAFAISMQIYNGLNTLSSSLVLPFRPAMVKAYAAREYSFLNNLFTANNKSIFYFFLSICIPIFFEIRTILTLWLGNISEDTVIFSRLMIIYSLILTMHNPITIIMHATGTIKAYHLSTEIFTLLSFPVSLLLFACGFPSYSIFLSMIGCCIIAHVVRLVCINRSYPDFSLSDYISSFFIRALLITIVSVLVNYQIHQSVDTDISRLVSSLIAVPIATLSLAYIVGLKRDERLKINAFALSIIKRL